MAIPKWLKEIYQKNAEPVKIQHATVIPEKLLIELEYKGIFRKKNITPDDIGRANELLKRWRVLN